MGRIVATLGDCDARFKGPRPRRNTSSVSATSPEGARRPSGQARLAQASTGKTAVPLQGGRHVLQVTERQRPRGHRDSNVSTIVIVCAVTRGVRKYLIARRMLALCKKGPRLWRTLSRTCGPSWRTGATEGRPHICGACGARVAHCGELCGEVGAVACAWHALWCPVMAALPWQPLLNTAATGA